MPLTMGITLYLLPTVLTYAMPYLYADIFIDIIIAWPPRPSLIKIAGYKCQAKIPASHFVVAQLSLMIHFGPEICHSPPCAVPYHTICEVDYMALGKIKII